MSAPMETMGRLLDGEWPRMHHVAGYRGTGGTARDTARLACADSHRCAWDAAQLHHHVGLACPPNIHVDHCTGRVSEPGLECHPRPLDFSAIQGWAKQQSACQKQVSGLGDAGMRACWWGEQAARGKLPAPPTHGQRVAVPQRHALDRGDDRRLAPKGQPRKGDAPKLAVAAQPLLHLALDDAA